VWCSTVIIAYCRYRWWRSSGLAGTHYMIPVHTLLRPRLRTTTATISVLPQATGDSKGAHHSRSTSRHQILSSCRPCASPTETIHSSRATSNPLTTLKLIAAPLRASFRTHPHDLPIPRLDAADIGLAFAITFFGPRVGLATFSTAGPMLKASS
jgi:hypothetical protein